MKPSMTCRHCGEDISGDDEDRLVTAVQDHARTHGDKPEMTAEHILHRLHRLHARHDH